MLKFFEAILSLPVWVITEVKSVKNWTLVALFFLWHESIKAHYSAEIFTGVMAIVLPTIFYIRTKEKQQGVSNGQVQPPH